MRDQFTRVIDAVELATADFFRRLRSELGQSKLAEAPSSTAEASESFDRPRGWVQAVLDKIAGMPETFRFSDVYSDQEWFAKNFPGNQSITQSVAGVLRDLTREGFLEQVKRGEYRRLDDPNINAVDTVVVPARADGLRRALSQQKWSAIRLHSTMKSKIKYLAIYQVAPISAVTHIATVEDIISDDEEPHKYSLHFTAAAEEIQPVRLVPGGRVSPLRNIRYTTRENLLKAKTLDELWPQEHPGAA